MTRTEYNLAIEMHADGLYRFILKNIRDSESSKDVVQEVFAKLWVKHKEVTFEKVKSYLFTAAYRTMIDTIRKNKKVVRCDNITEYGHSHNDQYSDLKEVIEEAVSKLPDVQRASVLLRDYEGYSYKEIGGILDLNESQVKVYIFRARKFLQDYLKSVEAVL